jgi:hypothetical protein
MLQRKKAEVDTYFYYYIWVQYPILGERGEGKYTRGQKLGPRYKSDCTF